MDITAQPFRVTRISFFFASFILARVTVLDAAPAAGNVAPVRPVTPPVVVPAPERIREIQGWLGDGPVAPGRPASDRAAWCKAAEELPVAELFLEAERIAAIRPPSLTDESFLHFSRTGSRSGYQESFFERLMRLGVLARAEGLEGRGRFLPALEREIEAILEEKTWVLPWHDERLENFSGKIIDVDLASAARGWTLAIVDYWHGEKLSGALRARLRSELRRRVIEPYFAVLHGGARSPSMWWITGPNNWNAVCHAGVIGTALALGLPASERAELIAAAQSNLAFFLDGFPADGYCSEGVGYWCYGFGHCVMLAEMIAQATNGRLLLLSDDKARRIIAYPDNLEILPDIYPSFADSYIGAKPERFLQALAQRQLIPYTQRGLLAVDRPTAKTLRTRSFYEGAMQMFLPVSPSGKKTRTNHPLRHWFSDAQVLVTRAAPNFGAAIKGGHNDEHHNHNDVGSFVIASGSSTPLVDPGLEIYSGRTFSADRYQSNVINSFGHPVPIVAGQMQMLGRERAARVVQTQFTDEQNLLVLDLRAAYPPVGASLLQRSFVARRGAHPEIVVTDTVRFDEPKSFGTALITFGPWREEAPGVLIIGEGKDAVRVRYSAKGGTLRIKTETIEENLPENRKPARLGFDFGEPVENAEITFSIRPAH